MPYYFLDMEFCDLNLETYIKWDWKDAMRERIHYGTEAEIEVLLPILRLLQILQIMKSICSGLTFIHDHKEIHRDLKPRNGKPQYT